jgi:hypothetical protein
MFTGCEAANGRIEVIRHGNLKVHSPELLAHRLEERRVVLDDEGGTTSRGEHARAFVMDRWGGKRYLAKHWIIRHLYNFRATRPGLLDGRKGIKSRVRGSANRLFFRK